MNATGRTELWLISIKNIARFPFGWIGWESSSLHYSHNLWLDVDRVTGILPFIFLCMFTVSSIHLLIETIKISPENHYFNTTILVFFAGFTAVFFVEPIIEGLYMFFLIFCFYIGILSGYLKRTELVDKLNSLQSILNNS